MCGIALILNGNNPDQLGEMLYKMHHRGPDDIGTFFTDTISMGQVRLSIIDLMSGHQPIFNEKEDKCIIFNGEIYNYKEIKDNLSRSHIFKTDTDTEIILHLYEDMGEKCLSKLIGMFAFAIYDNGKIFIARDRLGIKPLYYVKDKNKNLIFASEIKALPEISGIAEFPPGAYYTQEKGFTTYYDLPFPQPVMDDDREVKNKIIDLLDQAVRRRLVADVPVGVFLSGGLDSSILTAIMRRHQDIIYSFAAGMEDSEDIQAARKVSEYLNTRHFEYIYTAEHMLKDLPAVIYHLESFDAPLVRSAIPNYYVSKLAQKHNIKVILTGEGADEIFGGYHYLKQIPESGELQNEIRSIINRLHFSNLQRTDRMSMAASVETRVPYLDIDLVEFALSIPGELKLSGSSRIEKHILRSAFEFYLPSEIIWRKKKKFSDGAGSMHVIENMAESFVDDNTFRDEKERLPFSIRSKEELYYYHIFRRYFGHVDPLKIFGRTSEYERLSEISGKK